MATITQVITALPSAPDPATDTPATFSTKAAAFVLAQVAEVTELNTWATQANALAAGLNAIATGSALAIPLTFSTTTTDSDPGNGIVRLNQAAQNTSTVIRTDLIGNDGSTWTDVIALFDDSTSTVKGFIMLVDLADATKWLAFSVASLATPGGYVNITVACVAYSAANPFANGASLALKFTRNGDKGDTGAAGTVDAANLASVAHAATDKTPPVDADEFSLIDSAAAWALKKLTWANLKATVRAYIIATANVFSGGQSGTYTTLTDAATIAVNLALNNFFKVQLGGNRTLGVPTGIVQGQSFLLTAYQDGTGSRTLAYSWPYQFASGTAPTLTTGKFTKDTLCGNVDFYASLTVSAITNGANAVVTSAGHGMLSGQKGQFSALTGSTGLAADTSYWVSVIDANTFYLSSSFANAQAGTYITTSSAFTSGTFVACTITMSAILAIA